MEDKKRRGAKKTPSYSPLFCRPHQEEGIAKHVLLLSCAKQQMCFPLVNIRMSLFVASTSHLSPPPSQGYGQGVYVCVAFFAFSVSRCQPLPDTHKHTYTSHVGGYASDTFPNVEKKSIHVFFKCRERVLELFFLATSFFFLAIRYYSVFYTTPPCYLFATLLCSSPPSARERW